MHQGGGAETLEGKVGGEKSVETTCLACGVRKQNRMGQMKLDDKKKSKLSAGVALKTSSKGPTAKRRKAPCEHSNVEQRPQSKDEQ